MPRKAIDRRVDRTRKLLKDALISLVPEKGFEKITVQDVIDRANVGRSTFYTHFESKEDLLVQGLDDLADAMRQIQRHAPRTGAGPVFGFVRELLAHTNDHRNMFRAMVGKRSGAVLQRRFHKMLTELLHEEMSVSFPRAGDARVPVDAVIQYLASGMYGLMAWWLDGPMRMSVDEITALFLRLATAAVSAAPAPPVRATRQPPR